MIVVSLVVSAVAVLLGLFTKLPQGGGGIVNNLMVISYFLPNLPYLPPPPPPKDIILSVDADIFGTRKFFLHHYTMTCNTTEDPMPQCYTKSRPPGWTGNSPKNRRFATPTFSLPPLPSLSSLLLKIGNIASIIIALCLPWLACTQLRLLIKTQKVTDSSLIKTAISGDQWQGIELHNRLFLDLQVVLFEHNKALAELEKVTIQAEEESKNASERVIRMEQIMKGLEKERDNAFEDRERGRDDFKRLGKEKDDEADKMKEEIRRHIKAWEKKQNDWEQMRKREERRHKEDKDGLKMGRERERESWKAQVERMKIERMEEKEEMEMKIKKIMRDKEREKEGWEKQREREQEKLEVEREAKMKILEAQIIGEKYTWETKNHLAQARITKMEEENAKWRKKAMENERAEEEQEAARIMSNGERELEKKYWEEHLAEARKRVSKLEGDLLSGRKLIEDLQTDKRIDRQLLLELRAQLVRPTHKAPPTHLSPLRFGGRAYAVGLGAPNVPVLCNTSTGSPQSQKATLPSSGSPKTAQTTLPFASSGGAISPELYSPIVRLPPANMDTRRPVVRLPPSPLPRQLAPSRLPTGSAPPRNAPIGPRGWTPDVKKAAYRA